MATDLHNLPPTKQQELLFPPKKVTVKIGRPKIYTDEENRKRAIARQKAYMAKVKAKETPEEAAERKRKAVEAVRRHRLNNPDKYEQEKRRIAEKASVERREAKRAKDMLANLDVDWILQLPEEEHDIWVERLTNALHDLKIAATTI